MRPYEQGLAEIRRRRAWMWAVFFGFFPVVIFAGFVISRFRPGPEGEATTAIVAVIWMALYAIVATWAGLSRCPRCGGRFDWGPFGVVNPFTQRCLHCRLPLRAGQPADGTERPDPSP
jgi:hypothetical protein